MSADRQTAPLFIPANQLTHDDHTCIQNKAPVVFHTQGRSGPEIVVYKHVANAQLREAFLQTGARKFNIVNFLVPRSLMTRVLAPISTPTPDRSSAQSPMPLATALTTSPTAFANAALPNGKTSTLFMQSHDHLLTAENLAALSQHLSRLAPGARATEEARLRDAGHTPFHRPFSITLPSTSSQVSAAPSENGSTAHVTLPSDDSTRFDIDRIATYRETHSGPATDGSSPMELSPQYTTANTSVIATPIAEHRLVPANGLPTIVPPPDNPGAPAVVNFSARAPLLLTAPLPELSLSSFPLPSTRLVPPSVPTTPPATPLIQGAALALSATVTTSQPEHPQPGAAPPPSRNPFSALLERGQHANTCCLFCRDVIHSIDMRTDNIHRLLVCVSELTRAGTAYAEELQHQALNALDDIEDANSETRTKLDRLTTAIFQSFTGRLTNSFDALSADINIMTLKMEERYRDILNQRAEDRQEMLEFLERVVSILRGAQDRESLAPAEQPVLEEPTPASPT